MTIKIESIELVHIRVPLKIPYQLTKVLGLLKFADVLVVKVLTDEGIMGLGETNPLVPFTSETPGTIREVILNDLGPSLLGQNPLNIALIHEMLDRKIKGHLLAKAPLDMACYDIMGKYYKTPVHTFLGGFFREEIPLMLGVGIGKPEENAKRCRELVHEGALTIMLKVGGDDFYSEVRGVHLVRESVGPEATIIVDANQGWDPETAIKFASLTEEASIALMEQPVPYWDLDGMAKVKKKSNIPVSADESLSTIHDAKNILQKEAADVFSIKVVKHGGIYKSKKIMDFAFHHGIHCLMNSMIEEGITQAASLHLGVSSKNICSYGHSYSSPSRLEVDITDYSDQLTRGSIRINHKFGLGIQLKESIVERYLIEKFVIQ